MPDDGAAGSRRPAGALVAEILALLRAAGTPLSPGQVRHRLDAAEPSYSTPSYSTVVTILSRLHAKGLLSRQRDGHAFVYTVVDEASLVASRMSQALDTGRDHDAVLTSFVSGLSGRDAELLRRLLGPDSGGPPGQGGPSGQSGEPGRDRT
jgi:predicted transcriptional regulator